MLDRAPVSPLALVGLSVQLAGLVVESLADWQKDAHKRRRPHEPITHGLYAIVRCPNYAGELLFYYGNALAGASSLAGHWDRLAFALFGLLCITGIMLGATKRLIKGQDERYAKNEAFVKYAHKAALFPGIF